MTARSKTAAQRFKRQHQFGSYISWGICLQRRLSLPSRWPLGEGRKIVRTDDTNPALVTVFLCAFAVVSTGCLEPDGSREPIPTELSGAEAPPGTTISNVETIEVEVPVQDVGALGDTVFLKVVVERAGQVYFGKVTTDDSLTLRLSVPLASESLHYELYDETGWRYESTIQLRN
jgi:hypothetical protein